MISANNISVYFGGQELFYKVSFMVNKGNRIGLVGKNGAGKSTLLQILSGEQSPNEGSISTPAFSVSGDCVPSNQVKIFAAMFLDKVLFL